MTDCPLCKNYGKKTILKKTDRTHNTQVEWQCPDCGWCVMKNTRKRMKKQMNKVLPPYPRKNRGGSYTTGCGVFWYRVWKEDYHDLGGTMGYESWLEANKRIDREERRNRK